MHATKVNYLKNVLVEMRHDPAVKVRIQGKLVKHRIHNGRIGEITFLSFYYYYLFHL